jgi:hypothetical protein
MIEAARPTGAGRSRRGQAAPEIPQLAEALDDHFRAHHPVAAARIEGPPEPSRATTTEFGAQMARPSRRGLPVRCRLLRSQVIIAEAGLEMPLSVATFPVPWPGPCPRAIRSSRRGSGRRYRPTAACGSCSARQALPLGSCNLEGLHRPGGRGQQGAGGAPVCDRRQGGNRRAWRAARHLQR